MRVVQVMKLGVLIFLVSSVLVACGNKGDTTETFVTEGSGVINDYGWEIPTETIKFNAYLGFGDQKEHDEKSGKMAQFLKDKFNVEIDVQYYSTDQEEKLNLMLASNTYPEVITNMSDSMAEKFIAQGRAMDLTDLIEQYGDNITRRLGEYTNLIKNEEGKIYKLPVRWGENGDVAGYDFAIRYDYFQETGLPMYTDLEGYYEALKAIVASHPTNSKGEKVYALSDNSKGETIVSVLGGAYGLKLGYKVDESTNTFTHWINTDEGLKMMKYINRFVREGLMDPDFLSNDYETWKTKVMNERIVGNIGTWWHSWVAGHEAWAEIEGENFDSNKRFMNTTVKEPGVEQHTLLSSNFIGTSRIIITDKCKQPENIIKWLNWEFSELGTMITGFGQPDEENVWNIVDGEWLFNEKTFDYNSKNVNYHQVKEDFGAGAFWLATSGGLLEDDRLDPRVTKVNTYDYWPINENGEFLDEGIRISWENYESVTWDATLYRPVFTANNPITLVNQTIKENLLSEVAKIITANSEEELEIQFSESRDKLNKLGLHDLEDFYSQSYVENKAKMEKN